VTRLHVALVSAGEVYGGVERFISTFARHLHDSGKGTASVFLFSDGLLAQELRNAGLSVDVLASKGRYDPELVSRLATAFRQKAINVVHAHGYKASILSGLAARRLGLPAVKTEHGALEPFSGLAALRMHANLLADRLLTPFLFKETVYITRDLQQARALKGQRGSRVIANGVPPMADQAKGERRDGSFHAGIVGRLVPVKGHEILFEAVGRMKHRGHFHLHVYGNGPLENTLKTKAAALGEGTVVFHGFVTRILEEMRNLNCLVMPSFNEGLPYTLLEAMHLGLPIVASNVGGMKEILVDGKTAELCPAGDADALAAALDSLVADPAKASALGSAAQEDARRRFDIAGMADAYLKLYAEVVS
jgi:glycosyltransferase involved in cell wall biosynthesis